MLEAPLGIHRYSVVVDAKSTGNEKVTNGMVDWLAIGKHRKQHGASHACVVAPAFPGGQLIDSAREFSVTLLSTSELSELVALHEAAPLTLLELRPLFDTPGLVRASLVGVRAASVGRARTYRLLSQLLRFVDDYNRTQPNVVLARPETLLGAALASPKLKGTTLDEVRKSLQTLETLGVVALYNGEGYVSQTTLAGGLQLIEAFASHSARLYSENSESRGGEGTAARG